MKYAGNMKNHGWLLIILGIIILVFRIQYDTVMSLINGPILVIAGIAVVWGQYRDPEARTCQVCAATSSESKLGPKMSAFPLVLPIILLIITPMIVVDDFQSEEWINQVVGEIYFDEIPENRLIVNLFELTNFGEKYDGLYIEVNGSIIQRRTDGFQLHQYVPLCTCCPPVEVTIWVYYPVSNDPSNEFIIDEAELGKTDLYTVIGLFRYNAEQNYVSILLIHIEPIE